jgi:hypothetical protein
MSIGADFWFIDDQFVLFHANFRISDAHLTPAGNPALDRVHFAWPAAPLLPSLSASATPPIKTTWNLSLSSRMENVVILSNSLRTVYTQPLQSLSACKLLPAKQLSFDVVQGKRNCAVGSNQCVPGGKTSLAQG